MVIAEGAHLGNVKIHVVGKVIESARGCRIRTCHHTTLIRYDILLHSLIEQTYDGKQ